MADLHDVTKSAEPPAVTGKRKRRQGTSTNTFAQLGEYLAVASNEDGEANAIEDGGGDTDSDEDSTYGKKRRTTSEQEKVNAKKITVRSKAKRTLFPFMELPAELRNQIYEYAFVAKDMIIDTKHHSYDRRTFKQYGNTRYSDGQETYDIRPLVPNILAVSKEVRKESIKILYKQPFLFANMLTLHNFLATIGLENRKHLTDITVLSWGNGRGLAGAMNHSALTLLGDCVNLESLLLDADFYGTPVSAARRVHRAGVHFFYHYGVVHGNKCAGLEILRLGNWSLYPNTSSGIQACKDHKERFRNELARLLTRQRRR